jgi:hypothetical protein
MEAISTRIYSCNKACLKIWFGFSPSEYKPSSGKVLKVCYEIPYDSKHFYLDIVSMGHRRHSGTVRQLEATVDHYLLSTLAEGHRSASSQTPQLGFRAMQTALPW